MPVETVSFFFGLLAVGGALGFVAVGALMVVTSRATADSRVVGWLAELRRGAVPLAFLAAATATVGSLYYSEIAGFVPCRLCWVQRFFMYPSAVLLLLGIFRPRIRPIPLVACLVGFGVSVYHRLEQQFPDTIGGSCDVANPCSGRWVNTFGFITIPTMAAVAFALVVLFLALSRPNDWYRPRSSNKPHAHSIQSAERPVHE